jgi:endonuclease/exonuclease/phosphatase family metal-dependent hydrolase
MTQNMDAGTDLNFAIAELLGMLPQGVGVQMTYQEVLASALPERIDLLASAIAAKRPDILGLQEVTLWRTGETPQTATTVLVDQLQLLLSALAAHGVPYDVAAVNTVGDLALPMAPAGALRMTDRNVLLTRADLMPPAFHLSDIHSNLFDAVYSLGPVQAASGWISAMVHSGDRHFRLFMTHLQSPVPNDPASTEVQEAQAKQLLVEARNFTDPVVFAGDFNSDAFLGTKGSGPDNTGTAALIAANGFADAWAVAGAGDGYTWPLYVQDQLPPSFTGPATPYERIDLIFVKALSVVSIERIIAAAHPWASPAFGSDHAGVLAAVQF